MEGRTTKRGERKGEEIPPRVTQAHSRSFGRKLTVGLRMLGFMCAYSNTTRLPGSPPGPRLCPTLPEVLATRVTRVRLPPPRRYPDKLATPPSRYLPGASACQCSTTWIGEPCRGLSWESTPTFPSQTSRVTPLFLPPPPISFSPKRPINASLGATSPTSYRRAPLCFVELPLRTTTRSVVCATSNG